MKKLFKILLFTLLSVIILGMKTEYSLKVNTVTSKSIITQMLKSIAEVKTLSYNLKNKERIKGKVLKTESVVKLQMSPRKLYLYLKGPEVLWAEGENNGKALVNPGAFPYINLNLDPYGSLMRQEQHHTIHEMGYTYLAGIIQSIMRKAGDNFDKTFIYIGDEKWNNRDCYKITISNNSFGVENYTVQKGENLVKIARKLSVSEYMILENNPKVDNYNDVKAGNVISVPNSYAKLCVLLIDKQYMLPINNTIYDNKGMYENYEYYNLLLNIKFKDEEFTKEFPAYHF